MYFILDRRYIFQHGIKSIVPIKDFKIAEEYYSTLFHEMIHVYKNISKTIIFSLKTYKYVDEYGFLRLNINVLIKYLNEKIHNSA